MNKEIGDYEPNKQEKGKQEAFCDGVKEGQTYWTVKVSEDGEYDTKYQDVAIILSELLQVKQLLKSLVD